MAGDRYDENYEFFKRKRERQYSLIYQAWIALRVYTEIYKPLGLTRDQNLLDAGCNIGDLGHYLGFLGVSVMGVDLNLAALLYGRRMYFSKVNKGYVQGSVVELPYPSKHFNFVLSQDVLEHMPDVSTANSAFLEMARVCDGKRMLHKVTVLEDRDWIHADVTHHVKETAAWWKNFFYARGWDTLAPTTRMIPNLNRRTLIGFGPMHGYFLIERQRGV